MRRYVFAILVCSLGCSDGNPTAPTAPVNPEFSLSGTVFDTAFRPLPNVIIEVVGGPRNGANATTDASGRYALTGTFTNTVSLRASRDGYVPVIRSATANSTSGPQDLSFSLEQIAASTNIAGEYTLTLSADASCTELPAIARMRSYPVTITREASSLSSQFYKISPTAGTFYPSNLNNSLNAGVAGSFVRVMSFDYGIGLVEQVAPNTYVSIWGASNAEIRGPTISGVWSGGFEYCEGAGTGPGFFRCSPRPMAYCEAVNHRLTITRR
jgi:hypothetical protein